MIFRDGHHLTLQQVFESLNLTAYDLSIDTLDMHVCFLSCIIQFSGPRLTKIHSIALTNSIWSTIQSENLDSGEHLKRPLILSFNQGNLFENWQLYQWPIFGRTDSRFVFATIKSLICWCVEVISDLEASKYQMAEYRISIYGRFESAIFCSISKWSLPLVCCKFTFLSSHYRNWIAPVPLWTIMRVFSICCYCSHCHSRGK